LIAALRPTRGFRKEAVFIEDTLGNAEQVLRQAQDERQLFDCVRGELVEPHSKPTCSAFPLRAGNIVT
jgi:hypothetical protein